MDNLAIKPHVKAIRDALKVIPRKLEDTYNLVMERITDQNDDDADLARRVLSWLTYSMRPLKIIELQYALAIGPDQDHIDPESLVDEETMLSVCAGIVTVEDENKTIQFIHYTTQEYLERIRESRFPIAQLEITEACMNYLQQQFQAVESISPWPPLYEYASMQWGAHADENVQKIAETKILSFLNTHPTLTGLALQRQYCHDRGSLILPRHSSFHVAAYFGLFHILSYLIATSIKSDVCDNLGQTPLHIAISRNHRECVRILLDDDRQYGNKLHRAWILLRISAIRGLPEFAQLALENGVGLLSGPDPITMSYRGWTVLHVAVLGRHVAMVEFLCASGFDIESTDLDGNSALHIAAQEGYDDIVHILVAKGAEINKRNRCAETPLHLAAGGKTAWIFAEDSRNCKACAQVLLEHGAEINCTDQEGRTPLYLALMWGEDIASLILRSKGYLNLNCKKLNLLRNINRSGSKIFLPHTFIFKESTMSLEQAIEKCFESPKLVREERLKRFQRYADVINASTLEQLLVKG
jgi:ankyrin repeat protein